MRTLHKTDHGFTMIEIIMVISLLLLVAGLTFYFNLDSYRGYSFHDNRDTLISALQHARAEAISNVCGGPTCTDGKPHGVAIRPADHPNSYVIFQTELGKTYDDRTTIDKDFDALLDASPTIAIESGSLAEIIFTQLSGDVTLPGDIKLKDNTNIHQSVISINSEGQIIWTN